MLPLCDSKREACWKPVLVAVVGIAVVGRMQRCFHSLVKSFGDLGGPKIAQHLQDSHHSATHYLKSIATDYTAAGSSP